MYKHTIAVFGEVLFDHFPDGSRVLGGAPFNVAWHLQAFRQRPRFISRIGSDPSGDAVVAGMHKWTMDLSDVQRDDKHPTGRVEVAIEHGEPSYCIVPEQAYDYIDSESLDNNGIDWLYHGTLALRQPVSRAALMALKEGYRGKVFMDVNLREPWWEKEAILDWLSQADWVKLNQHELAALDAATGRLEDDMHRFRERYGLDGLIVTRGKSGASAIAKSGEVASVVPGDIAHVIDTVGAGDAFASVVLLGLSLDWPLGLTMERAQSFASALVGQRGATVRDHAFYQPFITAWGLG